LPGDVLFIGGGVVPLLYICYLGVRHRVSKTTTTEPGDILFTELTAPPPEPGTSMSSMRTDPPPGEPGGPSP
jgi:hypothetical protein